jgi:hypothetical protein
MKIRRPFIVFNLRLSLAGVEEDNVAVCTRKKSSLGES